LVVSKKDKSKNTHSRREYVNSDHLLSLVKMNPIIPNNKTRKALIIPDCNLSKSPPKKAPRNVVPKKQFWKGQKILPKLFFISKYFLKSNLQKHLSDLRFFIRQGESRPFRYAQG